MPRAACELRNKARSATRSIEAPPSSKTLAAMANSRPPELSAPPLRTSAIMAVFIAPGAMQLTVTPWPLTSSASVSLNRTSAAFALA